MQHIPWTSLDWHTGTEQKGSKQPFCGTERTDHFVETFSSFNIALNGLEFKSPNISFRA